MYSGTTLRPLNYFDAWFGAHQKIDRTARRFLGELIADRIAFPSVAQITKFEGMNGPDGIKRKSPAQHEPWHFYDPANPQDDRLVRLIDFHYRELVKALTSDDTVRAAFEAAWLAHAIVDGLTPAHHYPYEAELTKLRKDGIASRTSAKEKLILPGENLPQKLGNNWKMWGDKGLVATHFAFEWGIAIMATPLRLNRGRPAEADLDKISRAGAGALFAERAEAVAALDMYRTFYKWGWTPKLAKAARRELLPLIVNTVTLAWYGAALASWQKA